MAVDFEDFTIRVTDEMNDRIEAVLEECAGEMVSQVKRNSRVGQPGAPTKNSFKHKVAKDGESFIAVIGSNEENAIWEEFGTGEHAIPEGGGGRRGAWYVPVEKVVGYKRPTYNGEVIVVYGKGGKKYYKTNGKKPSRAFWKAYTALKSRIINRIQEVMRGL